MINKILELAMKSADVAEVFWMEGENSQAEFDSNRLKSINTKSTRGVGLRVVVNGRIGFSSTTDLAAVEQLVINALESARYGQEARFELPSDAETLRVAVHDPKLVDFPIGDAIIRTSESIDAIRAAVPRIQCSGGVSKKTGIKRIVNSRGLDISYDYSELDTSLSALLVRDGSLLWTGDGDGSCAVFDAYDKYTKKILSDIKAAEREVVPESGRYPVIFTPEALGSLLDTFEQGVNGKLVQKGISPLMDKIGAQIVDTNITITDDPTLDYAIGSYPFDDEGIPARRNVLIENGVLRNYLFDLQTAGIMNTQSTGNGSRGFSSLPTPDTSNLVVDAGDLPFTKMISQMKRGILADQLLGAGQSNILAGEFSVNLDLGFLIENGEVVGRVKDCMLAGNVFEAFNDIAAIGDESILKGTLKAPHICFANLSVASGA